MDIDKVKAAGHPTVVITILSNANLFSDVEFTESNNVLAGDNLIVINK